jgi:hypothetical protein
MTVDSLPDGIAASAQGNMWKIDLVHRSLAVRLQPDGQVRIKWFTALLSGQKSRNDNWLPT